MFFFIFIEFGFYESLVYHFAKSNKIPVPIVSYNGTLSCPETNFYFIKRNLKNCCNTSCLIGETNQ
ncbi:hypothetical protein B0A68_07105 [Flavobacterium reichenbachii]|uniref:Uncharacterized protein n=1 Tax=Flavobacterium reichenbachii TaxID=362418 RepID=A0A085ZLI8_9FLAO|nr:hypothetical protein IW19_07045 [Flavobacterium reichenbachii]OXB16030.1 hypothetical protein B0A68_07105 [Flavobacterium reichenbachii]